MNYVEVYHRCFNDYVVAVATPNAAKAEAVKTDLELQGYIVRIIERA